jgi:hypothetical protein
MLLQGPLAKKITNSISGFTNVGNVRAIYIGQSQGNIRSLNDEAVRAFGWNNSDRCTVADSTSHCLSYLVDSQATVCAQEVNKRDDSA